MLKLIVIAVMPVVIWAAGTYGSDKIIIFNLESLVRSSPYTEHLK